jgi:hypothetical protein
MYVFSVGVLFRIPCQQGITHAFMAVILMHDGAYFTVHVTHVPYVINREVWHVTHSAQGPIFVAVQSDVLHASCKLSCPEQRLVYSLIRAPSARDYIPMSVSLYMCSALLLFFHHLCVGEDGFGSAVHVPRAAPQSILGAFQHFFVLVDCAVLRHPNCIRVRVTDEEVI